VQLNFLVIGQSAITEVERVDQFFASAAAEESRTIARKFQTVETLRQRRVRNGFALFKIDNGNLVSAIAAVQHRNESTTRMNRNIDREIAQLDLPTDWAKRPLIGKEDFSSRLHSGQHACAPKSYTLRQRL